MPQKINRVAENINVFLSQPFFDMFCFSIRWAVGALVGWSDVIDYHEKDHIKH